jgi:hypothetical protein
MKETNGTTTAPTKTPAKTASKRCRSPGGRDCGEGASTESRRRAAAILEVLAGARTPTQAAETLELTVQRYYLLEVRALQGMLSACEPRSTGRVVSAESALAAVQRECDQWRRECGRQQALVRAAQRAIGLPPPAVPRPARDGKKHRRRRPVARALRAAAQLKETPVTPATPGTDANVPRV